MAGDDAKPMVINRLSNRDCPNATRAKFLSVVRHVKQFGSINHLGFNVESIEGALAYSQSKNIPLNWGGLVQYEDSESIYIEDPDGYEIEVSNNFAGGL